MNGSRPRLYKIRRYVKRDGKDVHEWYARGASWVDDPIDAYAYVKYQTAIDTCENMKVHNRDPNVIYHSVVPA